MDKNSNAEPEEIINFILENELSAEFRETAQIFITVFKRKSLQIKGNVHVGCEGNTTTNTTTKTTIKNLAADVNPNSSKGKILALISYNPSISLDELASSVNLTKDGVRYHINKLRKMGLLCREGTKGGKWVLHSIED